MIVASETPERCYGCFRPIVDCYCASIPVIENRTKVLILQHMRERFHPFNTARIVRKSLVNSRLISAPTADWSRSLTFEPGTGLLYPSADSRLISDLSADERPRQLVILDGTWHHAKTLMRGIATLRQLPCYRLAPTAPSRYRIRREPRVEFLSTLEATIAALRVLEPETVGFEQLMSVFESMVDRQLARPKVESGWRRKRQRKIAYRNIPTALLADLPNLVVAYGESMPRDPLNESAIRRPVYWVAERLGTGESFRCAIEPDRPLPAEVLGHMGLAAADFGGALSLPAARSAWSAFLRPHDALAVYNTGVKNLLAQLGDQAESCLVLKSVDFRPQQRYATFDDFLLHERVAIGPVRHPGRAGERLAKLTAFVRYLHALGNTPSGRSTAGRVRSQA